MSRCILQTLLVGSIPLMAACSDTLSPEATLAGTYVATTFTLSGDITGDVLAAGGGLTITLDADGTTDGTLFVPASLNDGEDFNANMAGTFTVVNGTVTFTQDADTFVRDLTWTVDGSGLGGSGTFSGVTITIVLNRQ
jgi:hypothetical protein